MGFKPAYPHLMQTVTKLMGGTLGSPAVGSVMTIKDGYIENCTITSNVIDREGGTTKGVFCVMAEAGTNAGAGTYSSKVYLITPESVWLADTDADPAYTNMGIACEIDETTFTVQMATSDDTESLVVPFEIYRAAADRKVLCRFLAPYIQGSAEVA